MNPILFFTITLYRIDYCRNCVRIRHKAGDALYLTEIDDNSFKPYTQNGLGLTSGSCIDSPLRLEGDTTHIASLNIALSCLAAALI